MAAGAMSVSPVTSVVHAMEDVHEPIVENKQTKDEVLETLKENVNSKKEELNQAQTKLNEATPIMEEFSKQLDSAKASYDESNKSFNQVSQEVNSLVSNEIKVNQNLMDEAKQELEALKKEKERLEKESADSDVQKAQLVKDYQDAQNKYNELISQGTIEDLTEQIASQQKVVESMSNELLEAQSKYDAVKASYDEVTGKINDLENQVLIQQNKIDGLTQQLNADNAAMQEALNQLNNIQQAYDAATDENVKAELEVQLATAQTNLASATEIYDAANQELSVELNNLNTLQSDVESAKNESQSSIDDFNKANEDLGKCRQEKEKADNELSSLQQTLKETQTSIELAKADVQAKKEVLETFNSSADDLSKLVTSTKAAYDAVQAQWNQGSLGFYESIGDTQAVDVIKEGIALGTTTLGDIGDSTDLTNMKKSLPMLAECNRLRKVNGLPELKTSGLMMAISQVKVNHTVHKTDGGSPHTGLYNTGENLAGGFTWEILAPEDGEMQDASESGPFVGWYNWEKKFLDDFYAEHPEEKEKTIDETLLKYPDLFYRVGHYLNILTAYDVTGVSYVPENRNDLSETGGEFAQQFANNTDFFESHGMGLDSAINKDKQYDNRVGQMTVTEFTEKFNKYYDSLKADLETKQTAYNTAKKALNDAQNNEDAIANATKAYEEALAKLEKLKVSQSVIEGQIQNAEKVVSTATEKVTEAQANVTKAEAVKSEKVEAVKAAQVKVDAQQKIVDQKWSQVDLAKSSVDKANAEVKSTEDRIKESEQSVTTLKSKLDDAKQNYSNKQQVFKETDENVQKGKAAFVELRNQKVEKETQREELGSQFEMVKSNRDQAQENLDASNLKLASLNSSKKTRIELRDSLDMNLESQKALEQSLLNNEKSLNRNHLNNQQNQASLKDLELEATRLQDVMSLYHSIIDGIVAAQMDEVVLNAQEIVLFENLKAAVNTLLDSKKELVAAQEKYNAQKGSYNEFSEAVKKAQLAYDQAQNALDQYLRPEEKVETVNTSTSKVNTGMDLNTEMYLGSLVVAGVAYTILLRKKKEEEN